MSKIKEVGILNLPRKKKKKAKKLIKKVIYKDYLKIEYPVNKPNEYINQKNIL